MLFLHVSFALIYKCNLFFFRLLTNGAIQYEGEKGQEIFGEDAGL